MTNAHQGTITVPYKYVNTIARGMTANIEFEGYDAETYGVANGMITGCKYKLVSGMTGTASVLVSNESILQKIIQRITNII